MALHSYVLEVLTGDGWVEGYRHPSTLELCKHKRDNPDIVDVGVWRVLYYHHQGDKPRTLWGWIDGKWVGRQDERLR